AVTRIAHGALELAGEIVGEHLMVLPSELEHLVVQDGQPFAEHRRAAVHQRRYLAVKGNDVEPAGAADLACALVELAVVDLEPLGEAGGAAHDLALRTEIERYRGVAALRRQLRGSEERESQETPERGSNRGAYGCFHLYSPANG